MDTFPYIFLILFCLAVTTTTTSAADDLFCNAADKAALLKIRDHFGGPNGRLSDWDSTTDCCTDWSFVGCDLEYQGEPGRVTTVTISRGWGLSGTLPAEFGDLPFLSFLSLSDEPNVTGPIPQSYSKLSNLQKLELNSNSLSGPIPSFLGQLKKLQELDLSNNRFTGQIPASIGSLTGLNQFNVSFNQLCGAIPSGLKKFGAGAFAHNKCLCGAPLPAC
ncbi:hypothetical protein RND81_14G053100 [Saponaria officinalis]|uniref:Leucine-rich repeat-containing N-terminal plant-type domain-containing protein n=1 Tax=Saponaria officinalis TaxID=3572 RepID=A0AAW1GM42_SAPOF